MEISEIDLQLVKAAFKALENSYSPYSRFKVGAAVRSIDGSVFTGCNVENASFAPNEMRYIIWLRRGNRKLKRLQ